MDRVSTDDNSSAFFFFSFTQSDFPELHFGKRVQAWQAEVKVGLLVHSLTEEAHTLQCDFCTWMVPTWHGDLAEVDRDWGMVDMCCSSVNRSRRDESSSRQTLQRFCQLMSSWVLVDNAPLCSDFSNYFSCCMLLMFGSNGKKQLL